MVPGGSTAVAYNVTVTDTVGSGYVQVAPGGTPSVTGSSINWSAGQTLANGLVVGVDAARKVKLFAVGGGANVIIDIVGYYAPTAPAGLFHSLTAPTRVYDSRFNSPTGVLAAGTSRTVPVTTGYLPGTNTISAVDVVPGGSTAVAYNVTVTDTVGSGYVQVAPGGTPSVTGSSINWSAGQTLANGLVVGVDAARKVKLFAVGGGANVIIDIVGYFSPTSPPGKLAFTTDRTGNFEVFSMAPNGASPTNLTNASGSYDDEPSWSPDGSRIAFTKGQNSNYDVFSMNADGSDQINLTNDAAGGDGEAAWSPDGSKIAFSSNRDGVAEDEVYVMNADGSDQTNLSNDPSGIDSEPTWSPDGSKIAFTKEVNFTSEIWVMNADGSNQVDITNNPAEDTNPAWSPDGTKIAFASTRGNGSNDIYLMGADGSNPVNLTNDPSNEGFPAWSPDGSEIAFVREISTPDFDIFVMGSDGSNPVDITNNDAYDGSPSWSHPVDGKFQALPAPTRVYDSRYNTPTGKLVAGSNRTVSVTTGYAPGTATVTANDVVPAGAKAVAYNVTVTDTSAAGYLQVAPGGTATVTGSSINWSPGQSLANGLVVGLDADRTIKLFAVGSSASVIVDIVGYYF